MNIPMFRAWDKQYKKMGEVTMLLFLTDELDHSGNNGEPKKFEHFELMQFIGLKDKNGKNIYEGDILKGNFPYLLIVGFNVESASFGASVTKDFKTENMYWFNNDIDILKDDFEIVGNIFEHPNLLQ